MPVALSPCPDDGDGFAVGESVAVGEGLARTTPSLIDPPLTALGVCVNDGEHDQG
jgi:hypothetical protein